MEYSPLTTSNHSKLDALSIKGDEELKNSCTSTMELISFITTFFISKQISLMTAFTCWPPEATSKFVRSAANGGVRVTVYRDFLQAPALLPNGARREGLLLDADCANAVHVIHKASKSRAFIRRYTWLLLHDSALNSTSMEELLDSVEILPDADVTWSTADAAVEVYRVKVNHPLIATSLELTRNDSLQEMETMWNKRPSTVTRRRNLRNVFLKAATVITQPQHFKGWFDLTNRQIDTFPKFTYPLMMLLAEDLNYRHNLMQLDLYGEDHNGSFDGLVGMLQREEAEVGVTSMFMRADRWRVVDYVSETCELRGAFLFRQPSQSSVANVFLLPFSRGVWAACGAVLAAAALLLAALARRLRLHHPQLEVLTLPETVSFAIGTICQQGSHVTPDVTSIRLVMFSALVSSLFAFTSYSAKIVAILQTPSNALQTIDDLAHSPMSLGVQETTYKRVYFAESSEPATQRLYRRKLLPLGERAYVSVVEGVARLRTGLFAFQVEQSSGYEIISKTFTEREKCGLQEIQAFKLPMVAIPLRKHSGYRELFASRVRWQREAGLTARARRRWLAGKPRCEAGAGGFLSVRLLDVLPAFQILSSGAVVACLMLGAECAVHGARRLSCGDSANQ